MTKSHKAKKILIVTGIFPPETGGPASYAPVLAESLKDQAKITVITYSPVLRFSGDKRRSFKVIRIWKKWPWFLRHLMYAAAVFWEAADTDVVYVMSTINGGLPSVLAARIFKKRVLIKIVGDYAWQQAILKQKSYLLIDDFQKVKKTGWIGILSRLQNRICRSVDKIIVPSEYLAGLVRGWGVPPEKITVIYNGVDFHPLALSHEEARKKIGIAGNIILSVGRLVPWKGFRMLAKIMPELLKINQFFRLVIVGEGPEEKYLKSIIRNLGLEKKVYLTDRKSAAELAVYLAAAEIFILNTAYEGFSHQILEAMTAGVPVITTSAGGNREVIQQGENGFMVRYNDEFNLVEAVKTVWQIKELRERFIEEGKKTVERFGAEKMLKETQKELLAD